MLEVGHLPETTVKDPDYYALPPQLCTLGAYPKMNEHHIHTTKRQGIRSFNHNAFSRIVRHQSTKEVYQLHTWEYLFAERLIGYVVSENEQLLSELKTVENFGCKIGKEGYAFVDKVSGPTQLVLEQTQAKPDTLLPGAALVGVPCEAFPLYRYAWGTGASQNTNLAHFQNQVPLKGLSLLWPERFARGLNLIIILMATFISRNPSLMNCGKEKQMVNATDIEKVEGRTGFL